MGLKLKVFDLHIDLSSFYLNSKKVGFPSQVDSEKLSESGVELFLANICPVLPRKNGFKLPKNSKGEFLKQLYFYQKGAGLKNFPIKFLSIEGAYFIEKDEDLKMVPDLKRSGIVSIAPVWSISNSLGSGVLEKNKKRGLTKLGKKFLRECEENGIFIDASHTNEKTFWDIAKFSKKPFFVSHTASSEIFKHRRNLTKEQIRTVAKNGGIIGLCFVKDFLGEDSMDAAISHLRSLVNIAGIESIAIGSDFAGMTKQNVLSDMKDISFLPVFFEACKRGGFKQNDLERISYKNAERFFKSKMI